MEILKYCEICDSQMFSLSAQILILSFSNEFHNQKKKNQTFSGKLLNRVTCVTRESVSPDRICSTIHLTESQMKQEQSQPPEKVQVNWDTTAGNRNF